MGVADVMMGLAVEKKASGESKHYIPFNKTEWAALETKAGRELKPNDLKKLIQGIFEGQLVLTKAEPKAEPKA